MKTILLFCSLLFPFFTSAQLNFSIHGTGKGFKEGDRIFLQYKSSAGVVNDSVVVINKGEFHFKGTVTEPVRASLYRNQNPKYANEIFDYATVYLEKGNIRLYSPDTLLHSVNSGTSLNKDYSVFLTALQPFNEKGKMLRDPFSLSDEEMKDTAFVMLTHKKMQDHIASMVPVKFDFVNSHLYSFVSLVTLSDLVRDSRLLEQVDNSFRQLSPELKLSPMGKSLEHKIMLGKKISVGVQAKDFSLPDLKGKPVKLSDYKGKYILLDFWASWCGPCRAENPNVLRAFTRYKDKGFMVLSVSIDEEKDKSAWLKAIKEDGMIWPQLSDLKGNNNQAYSLYGITTIPANVLISPDGLVIAKDLKGEDLQLKLASIFK